MFKILVISYIGRTQNSDTTTKGLFKVIIIIQKVHFDHCRWQYIGCINSEVSWCLKIITTLNLHFKLFPANNITDNYLQVFNKCSVSP